MTTAQICILTAIVLYLAGTVLIGIVYSRRSAKDTGSFYLGGRKLGPLVTAMSAEASDMSSWLLMGLPGVAYFTGIADAAWTAIGLCIGTYLNFLFVAKRLRIYSEELGAITVPEFISKRFGDKRNILLGIAALIILIFFIPYTASGFAAVGKLFNSLFGFDYMTTMLIGAVIISLYTILGGFLAVSTTDFIQSIVMSIALIVVLIFGIQVAGGWGSVMENASQISGYLSLTNLANVVTKESSPYGIITICSTLAWGLGYFGMPHILVRFMGIKDPNKLALSRRVATGWVIISMGVAILIGIVGLALSGSGAILSFESASAAEAVIVKIADLLSTHGIAAALMAGIILAGILASTMSTADSQLLAASSSVSEDLLRRMLGIRMSDKTTMWVARLTVVVIALIAIFLAGDPNSSVFTIVSFAWAGFGATFAPVMLAALFWKRANLCGALAGMISGAASVFIWKYAIKPMGGIWGIYELLPAFLVAVLFIVVVSLLTAKPDREITDTFDKIRAAGK